VGAFDQIDPRDIKVAKLLTGGLAVNGTAAFAAPANNNATRHRYLLSFETGYTAAFAANAVQLEDVNGNLLVHAGLWTGQQIVLPIPMPVGIPGQNGLQLRNTLVAGAAFQAWVMFADLRTQLTAEIFRT
jgi:hypothetical protein